MVQCVSMLGAEEIESDYCKIHEALAITDVFAFQPNTNDRSKHTTSVSGKVEATLLAHQLHTDLGAV